MNGRYNRAVRPATGERTMNGVLSDREIDRRIRRLVERKRREAQASTVRRRIV